MKLGNKWSYIDNYPHHYNGRIWLLWNDQEVKIKLLIAEEQFIHVEVMNLDNETQYCATIVYALNQLDRIGDNMNMPWIVMGDYNNVLTCKDRIGGNPVAINEYKDLMDMMMKNGLYEAPTKGSYYIWSNKHSNGAIYSRIDRLVGNSLWFQTYQDVVVEVLPPHISDHSPIRVRHMAIQHKRQHIFKFLNCVTKRDGYHEIVRNCWNQIIQGTHMQQLWFKMKKLQKALKPLHREFSDIRIQIIKARDDLEEAHKMLQNNPFDCTSIELVKSRTDRVLELNQMKECILKQKS
ncbi:uncharacterized protein LOC131636618 [Vicia villosa]|uniref:uncharacterized protein LOC131636618 n=1 Tax=Vicia villosa TaxID=3911 RepID=UPI00273A968C|nr:uncharacterized protein LOC131636618 [Vicia villosa]